MAFTFESNALVTSEQVSKFIWGVDDASVGASPTLSSQQVFSVQFLVNSISAQIRRHVNSSIVAGDYTETWDGAASDELIPRERPINSVASIKFSGNGDFTQSDPLPNTGYFVDKYSVKFRGGMVTPRGRGLIQITYNAGYSAIPNDIVFATLLQLQWGWRQIGKGDSFVGIKQMAKMHESQVKDTDIGTYGLRAEVVGLLSPYRSFMAPMSVMFTKVS